MIFWKISNVKNKLILTSGNMFCSIIRLILFSKSKNLNSYIFVVLHSEKFYRIIKFSFFLATVYHLYSLYDIFSFLQFRPFSSGYKSLTKSVSLYKFCGKAIWGSLINWKNKLQNWKLITECYVTKLCDCLLMSTIIIKYVIKNVIVTELIQWHQIVFPVDWTNYNAVHNSLEICKVSQFPFSLP